MIKVLYHAGCNDGSGAALAAWLAIGDDAEYIPVQYGNPPPSIDAEDILYIVDFSYPRDQLLAWADMGCEIVVLDHHKTAEADLKDLDKEHKSITVHFDMEKSGAVITWEYFHKKYTKDIPRLFKAIQDRDLWKFEFATTRDITTGLKLYPDWKKWKTFIDYPAFIEDLIVEGRAINFYLDRQAEKIVKNNPPRYIKLLKEEVFLANITGTDISDVLHKALETYKEIPFAVSFFMQGDGSKIFSLRSRKGENVDVSEIAKSFGGGGHKHAAGFKLSGLPL